MFISRRKFMNRTSKAGIGAVILGPALGKASQLNAQNSPPKISIFSKHLQWLDYQRMAETAAEIGFDGVDLTVRPKGHVLPENVSKDLPAAVSQIRKAGIEPIMITTAIRSASEPETEQILSVAGELGISYYRMGWLKYDRSASVKENLLHIQDELLQLAEINQKYNIKGAYQNHSGNSFGSAVWDLAMVLHKINSPWLGCQYDIRHAVVEGAHSWTNGFDYIAPFINTIDIKDFLWEQNSDGWRVKNVPLGDGKVDFALFFELLNKNQINAPLSIHYEYELGGAEHGHREIKLPPDEIIKALAKDLAYVRSFL